MSESPPARVGKADTPSQEDGEHCAVDSTELSAETHVWAQRMRRIGSRAVRAAQEESRRQGVPNVYSIGGVLHYERPDGSLSTADPLAQKEAP